MIDTDQEDKLLPGTEYQKIKQNWEKSSSKKDNTGVDRPEYYDVLTTEDCFEEDVADNIILGYN